MRTEMFQYVRKNGLCQRTKPDQNARVEWHTAEPSPQHMEKFLWTLWTLLPEPNEGFLRFLLYSMVSLSVFASSQSGEYPRKTLLIAWKGISSPRMVLQVPYSRTLQVCSDLNKSKACVFVVV